MPEDITELQEARLALILNWQPANLREAIFHKTVMSFLFPEQPDFRYCDGDLPAHLRKQMH